MKHLVLISLIIFIISGCCLIPNISDIDIDKNKTEQVDLNTAEGQQEQLTVELGLTMRYGAIVCIIATIALFVLSFKIQALAHLCVLTGSGAVLCTITLYSLSYIWFIAGALFWGLVIYAGFKIYNLIKERNEERELSKELAMHFDDTEGHNKLSEKAKGKYIENKDKINGKNEEV